MKTVYTDGAFDLNAATHVNLYDPSVGVQRIYWSKNIKQGVPFSNASHYNNPRVDELLERAAVTTDAKQRKALFDEFQDIVDRELPVINLLAVDAVTIGKSRVKNHTLSEYGGLDSFASVYLTPGK